MRVFRALLAATCLIGFGFSALPTHAEDGARVSPVELRDSGKAYLSSLRGSRVVSDVAYFDPNAPAPDMTTEFKPPEPETEERGGDGGKVDLLVSLVAAALLAGVIFLIVKFGGASAISFSDRSDKRLTRVKRPDDPVEDLAPLTDLQQISAIGDRRAALIHLMRGALARAAETNHLALQRSWTARDALRRLPRNWPHLPALSDLTRAAELTHFGGRPVDEEQFQRHLTAARPLFESAGA